MDTFWEDNVEKGLRFFSHCSVPRPALMVKRNYREDSK